MTLHDTLQNNPALVDELLVRIDYYVKSLDYYGRGLPFGDERSREIYRSLILAWVQRLEANEPAGDTNGPEHEPGAGTRNT